MLARHCSFLYTLNETSSYFLLELELELIQTHMTQKPVLRVEVGRVDSRNRQAQRKGKLVSS